MEESIVFLIIWITQTFCSVIFIYTVDLFNSSWDVTNFSCIFFNYFNVSLVENGRTCSKWTCQAQLVYLNKFKRNIDWFWIFMTDFEYSWLILNILDWFLIFWTHFEYSGLILNILDSFWKFLTHFEYSVIHDWFWIFMTDFFVFDNLYMH